MQGDSFSNIGAGATIINRSTLANSLNVAKATAGEDVAEALAKVAELIELSSNNEAADNFAALSEELTKPQPKKSLMKTFWNGIREALPNVKELVELGDTIGKLFT